jgi:hypothetical protein
MTNVEYINEFKILIGKLPGSIRDVMADKERG